MNYDENNYYKKNNYERRQHSINEEQNESDVTRHSYRWKEDTTYPETYVFCDPNQSKYLRDAETHARNYNTKRTVHYSTKEENAGDFNLYSKRSRFSDLNENPRSTRSSLSSNLALTEEEFSNNPTNLIEINRDFSCNYTDSVRNNDNVNSGINDNVGYSSTHVFKNYVTEDDNLTIYNPEKGECSTNNKMYPYHNSDTVDINISRFSHEKPRNYESGIPEEVHCSIKYKEIEENLTVDMVIFSNNNWDLSPENADLVIEKISNIFEDWIMKTSDASITFQGSPTYLPDELYIKIQCSNERSVEWLRKTVNDMEPLWEGGKLCVHRLNELPVFVKCGLFLPKYNRDIKSLIKALTILNPNYNINEWRIHKYRHKDNGLLLNLGVPEMTLLEKVLPNNCKIYYRLGSVRLQFFSPEGTLVSEYIPANRSNSVILLDSDGSEHETKMTSRRSRSQNTQQYYSNKPYDDKEIDSYKPQSTETFQSAKDSFRLNYFPKDAVTNNNCKKTSTPNEVKSIVGDWNYQDKSQISKTVVSNYNNDNLCLPIEENFNKSRDPQQEWIENISKHIELNKEFHHQHDKVKHTTEYSKSEIYTPSYSLMSEPNLKTDFSAFDQLNRDIAINSADKTPPNRRFSVPELDHLSHETRRLFNRAKNTRRQSDWDIYKKSLADYNKALRKHGIKKKKKNDRIVMLG